MDKVSEKRLVGQPILKQILDLVPRALFDRLVLEHHSDRYYKAFDSWTQFITLLFGILSRCDSTTEIASGMQALHGKLNYLGLHASPAKSTIGDGLRNRSEDFFRSLYFELIDYFSLVFSVSRVDKIPFDHFYAFDSTTISLQPFFRYNERRRAQSQG